MIGDTLVPLQPTGSGPPLFCLPGATGSAHTYARLAQDLGHPVHGLDSPGPDSPGPDSPGPDSPDHLAGGPATTLDDLAAGYLDVVVPAAGGRPLCLLGWSMGGVLAFEMARSAARRGIAVPVLVLVDAPVAEPVPPPPEHLVWGSFLGGAPGAAWTGSPGTALDAAVASGSLPADVDRGALLRGYAVFRANVLALAAHRVTGPYDGPVVTVTAAASPARLTRWSRVAARVTDHVVPGDHHTLWHGAGLARLREIVATTLGRVSG